MPRSALRHKLVLTLIGLGFGLILSEACLRLLGYANASMYVYDEHRGWALRPGAEGWLRTESGRVYVKINSNGLRDRERAIAKPAGTFRVAVLGDSYSEAFQVPADRTFWAILEREMQSGGPFADKRVEVINFGVGGYGTAQELLTLRSGVWQYSPDLVLLAFCTENDVFNNLREINPTRASDAPYFDLQDGRLVQIDPFQGRSRVWGRFVKPVSRAADWATRFRLVQLLNAALRESQQRNALDRMRSQFATFGIAVPEAAAYLPPPHTMLEHAWRVTEALILAMRDDVRAHGARFLLVTLTNGAQVHPRPEVRRLLMVEMGVESLDYPDLRIRALAAREGIPIVTLLTSMSEQALKTGKFYHGFPASTLGQGHWNEEGHRLAGELIAREIVLHER
jgi:hypothetical protein